MSVKVQWENNLYFNGVTPSGNSVQLEGASGDGQGIRPSEMLLMALGGCTGMDIVSLLKKFNGELQSFHVHLEGEKRSEHPKAFSVITAVYHIDGKITKEQAVKAVSSSFAKYSVIANSLRSELNYKIYVNGEEVKK